MHPLQPDDRVSFNPYHLRPGDKFNIPKLVLQNKIVFGIGWDTSEDSTMDLDVSSLMFKGDVVCGCTLQNNACHDF